MIIKELILNPFAGISDLIIDFKEGLNVVVGPNEAGKSTLVNALKMALFVATKYDKRTFDKEISNFIPLSGGDTIQVKLAFSFNEDVYRLSKSWGGTKESVLTLPDGKIFTDVKSVQEKIDELLVLKEGTYHNIFFAYQSGLGATLDSLSREPEPTHDLASILREGFFATDGVSIEQLKQKIEEKFKDYFSHWDKDLKCPENNRGIENPYKKEVGHILEAFYEKERLYKGLNNALDYERQIDELNLQIQDLLDEISFLRDFIDRNKEIVEDARKRVVLELEIKSLQEKEKQLKEISQKWPALGQELKNLLEKLDDLRKKQEQLTKELDQVKGYESNKQKVEKFSRVEKKKKELEKEQIKLAEMKPIDERDFNTFEQLHNEIDRLKTSLSAGKIAVTMTSEKSMEFKVTRDLEEETSYSLEPRQPLELFAGGRIQLKHTDWNMNVKSGEMDFEKLNTHFNQVSHHYQDLLKKLAIADFEEGKRAYEVYESENANVKTLKKQYEEILEGEPFEELERLSKLVSQAPTYRSIADIAKDVGEINIKIDQTDKDADSNSQQLKEWGESYKSSDQLLDRVIEKRSELKNHNQNLQGLKPIPETVTNIDEFISEFEKKQDILKNKEHDLYEKRLAYAQLESQGPEETKEEIEIKWNEAQKRFEQVENEGKAILEIQETFDKIKMSMDGQTFDPWIKELQKVVVPLTLHRYTKIRHGENGFSGAERADGLEIPFQLISMGTKAGLGLALRLSMARYFLQNLEGFLIMDDPLVDMDPDRQQAAAQVIQNFSNEKQIIVLTCHPHHANLLGGHTINLNLKE